MRTPSQTLVAFDFDGTIVDTEVAEHAAWKSIEEEYGLHNLADKVRDAIVHGPQHDSDRLSGEVATQVGKEGFQIESMYRRRVNSHKSLRSVRPEALELLRECAAAGYRMILVSGARSSWFGHLMQDHDLYRYFEAELGRNMWKEGQSKADVFQYLRELYALEGVSEFIAVEDSPRGVTAAQEGGWTPVFLPNGLIIAHGKVEIRGAVNGVEAARHFLKPDFGDAKI